ncbi:MAG: hypothetical protein PHD95_04300 [Candidatus ainarchaeum sp.]|nr:hypothetical protein [Candidatus ainarchaeum sp.]
MDKKIILALALIIFFSINAFALESCPKEINYWYELEKETFVADKITAFGYPPNVLAYTNNGNCCGMNQNEVRRIKAVYGIRTASNSEEAWNSTLLKITMLKHNKDKLLQERGYTIDNDTWDFKFELIKPDGTVLSTVQKEIWESSNTAINAGRTSLDISMPDGTLVFHVTLDLDEDNGLLNGGQLDKIYVEAKQDIMQLMKTLANDNSATCIGSGCGFGEKDSELNPDETCPKELKYIFKQGKFLGINSENTSKYSSENSILYTAPHSNWVGETSGCFLSKGQAMTVNSVYLEMSPSNTPRKVKTSLLKITMKDTHIDKLSSGSDNDTWDFDFELLNGSGAAIKKDSAEIWEYSSSAEAADKTKLDIAMPDGTPVFHVALNMDSDAIHDGQLDKIYVEAKPSVETVMQKLAGAEPGSGTCPVGPIADAKIDGIPVGGSKFKMCKFSPGDLFGNLFNADGSKYKATPIFKLGNNIGVFVPPNPQQICMKDQAPSTIFWSTSDKETTKCYSGDELSEEQKNILKEAFNGFYNVFPGGVVEKYLKSVFAAKNAKSIAAGGTHDSGFNGMTIEMDAFLYSAKEGCLNQTDAKQTAIHEFTHLMDFHNCFIFSEADEKGNDGKWKFSGSMEKEWSKITPYTDYLGKNYNTVSTEKDGFIPYEISTYVRSDASEDLAETTAYLLMNNEDTKLISEKAIGDSKLKQKILLIEKIWSDATNGAMNHDWWCGNIDKLDVDCSVPAKNMNEAIQKINNKLLKSLGAN